MNKRTARAANAIWKRTCGWRASVLLRRSVWLGLALSLAGAGMAKAQITTISNGAQLDHPVVVGSMPDPNNGPRNSAPPGVKQRRIQALNIMRQQEVVSDTNKLLKLTTKLNAEIKESQAKSLTRHQLRMVAKIEKLAKNIREEMSAPIEASLF